MSWARRCSRNGCSATSTSSSGTSSPLAECEVRVETPLQHGKAKLVQPGDLRRDRVLVEDVRERSPPPEGERSSKHLGGPGGFVLEHGRRGMSEALEARCVEPVEIDPKGIAGRTRLQYRGRGIPRPAGLEARPAETWNQSFRRLRRMVDRHVDDPVRRRPRWVDQGRRKQRRCISDDPSRYAVVDDLAKAALGIQRTVHDPEATSLSLDPPKLAMSAQDLRDTDLACKARKERR